MVEGSVPRFWREIPKRYNLIGNQCGECKKVYFPPRETCPFCRRKSIGKMKTLKLSGEGEIVTYTIICEAPQKFLGQAPYPVAIIKLKEGPKVTAQIVDCDYEKVRIGSKVIATFRKIQEDSYIGAIHYGYKFKLCD
jgi:uncharacterized OB-fold protein